MLTRAVSKLIMAPTAFGSNLTHCQGAYVLTDLERWASSSDPLGGHPFDATISQSAISVTTIHPCHSRTAGASRLGMCCLLCKYRLSSKYVVAAGYSVLS
jgi:hypothetical protein